MIRSARAIGARRLRAKPLFPPTAGSQTPESAKSGHSDYEDSLRGRRRYEAVSREGILGDAEEAGYDLVETHTFLPEDNIYILIRRH